jgi:hypothetical protein
VVRSTRHVRHLNFNISANALQIRAVKSLKCMFDALLTAPN